MNSELRLSTVEIGSSAWHKVKTHAEERLASLRKIVENPSKSEAERLSAAWRISEFKELLELAQPAPQQAPQSFE